MRRSALRIASPLALALAVITCGDAATSATHHSGPGRIALQPQFTPEASQVLRSLAAYSFSINNVRLVLQRPPSFVLKDTVVFFTAGSDSVSIDMVVDLIAPMETLTARVQLRDGTTVLFEGVQSLTARQGSAASPPVNVAVSYVGPGAGATHVAVQTPNPAVLAAGTAQFTAAATDNANLPVAGLPISWTSSDNSVASVTAGGLATGLRAGTTTITASAPNGVSGSAVLRVTLAPGRLAVVSGDGQTGTVGGALSQPLVIAVLANDGTPVSGIAVGFRVTGGGGSVGSATATTDASGHATTTLTLGTTTGQDTFEASAAGVTALSVSEAASSAAATTIALASGDGQSGVVGSALALQLGVSAADRFGNTVQNATVNWTRVAGSGALAASSTTTRSDGLASVTYTLGSAARTDTVRADLSGASGSNTSVVFTMRGMPRAASVIGIVSGTSQVGVAGSSLANPLVVRVTDSAGNPAVGATVTWRIASGVGTLGTIGSTTDATGQTSTTFRLAPTAGTATIGAAISTATEVFFSVQGIAGVAASMAKMVGDGQSGPVGSVLAVAPSVRVADASGNPISGSAVTFTVTTGAGTVTAGSQVTNASGIATVGSWSLGSVLGPQSLTAAAGPLSVVFTANATRVATALLVARYPSPSAQSGVPFAPQPGIQLVDASGNAVSQGGVPVSVALYNATGQTLNGTTVVLTNATGFAAFVDLSASGSAGSFSLMYTAPGLTSTQSSMSLMAVVVARVFVADSGNGQVGPIGTALPMQLVVSARDSIGTPMPGLMVTWTLMPTTALATTTTDAAGRARILYTLGSVARLDDVRATLQGGLTVDFTETSGTAGVAWQISPLTVPTVTTSGPAFTTQPSVRVTDAFGSPVLDSGVVVTATVSSGYTLTGVTSATTNAGGVANFTNLGVSGPAGGAQANITFIAPPLKPATIGVQVN